MRLFLFFFVIQTVISAQTREITFVVTTRIQDTGKVYITGNKDSLGNWRPSDIPLYKTASGKWERKFNFIFHDTILYKFTLGDWELEALDDSGKVPPNNKLYVKNDTTISYDIKKWGKFTARIGPIKGMADYIRNVKAPGLRKRDIVIWLPPDYYQSGKRYPVLYAHDGQNIMDASASSWGAEWRMDETADSLIRTGEVEPMIIVGIYNTEDRYLEYSDNAKGYAYVNFIINQLKPLIDSTYHTLSDDKNTAVIGSSMGGLISFIMLWDHPEVFSKGACLSPAFVYDSLDYTEKVKQYKGARKPLNVYIDNGGVGLEQVLQPGVNKMTDLLKELGYKEGIDFKVVIDPSAEHTELAWSKRFPSILKFLFGKK